MAQEQAPLVAIVMGSKSDWDTMSRAADLLDEFGVPHVCRVLSAHRTPKELTAFMEEAEANGCEVFIGGAGGAAHLPGVMAAQTVRPVLGVPIQSPALQGLDSLLSIVQMPSGIPVGTMAIGGAGASNAALFAVAVLANSRPELREKIEAYRARRAKKVLDEALPKRGAAGFRP